MGLFSERTENIQFPIILMVSKLKGPMIKFNFKFILNVDEERMSFIFSLPQSHNVFKCPIVERLKNSCKLSMKTKISV